MRILGAEENWRAVVAVVAGTLLLVTDYYHTFFGSKPLTRTIFYLVIPLAIIILLFRESPARYGFRLGNWRLGLAVTVGGWVLMAAVMAFIARTGSFQRYYRYSGGSLPFWLADGIELFGWEFFFRGFLLFALYRACGPIGLVLQAVPFTMAHLGKPELETLSCIFGGTVFGYIAWRTDSFLYPFLIHWFLASFTMAVANGMIW